MVKKILFGLAFGILGPMIAVSQAEVPARERAFPQEAQATEILLSF